LEARPRADDRGGAPLLRMSLLALDIGI